MSKKSVKSFQQQIKSKAEPIINSRVSAAIENLTTEPVLSALWQIKFYFKEGSQGTSPLENIHRKMNASRTKYSSGITWDTAMMFISSIIFQHNCQILNDQTLTTQIENILKEKKQPSLIVDSCNFHTTSSEKVHINYN